MYQNVAAYFLGHDRWRAPFVPPRASWSRRYILPARAGRALGGSITQFANRSPVVIIRRAPAGNPWVRVASSVQSWAGRP